MILIIGTTEDDIFYFKNRMKITEKSTIASKYPYYVGTFAGKDICLAYSGYSNIASAVVASAMIARHHPYIVICVGTVSAFSENLHQSELFIAERVYLGDIDFTPLGGGTRYGQIKEMPAFYSSEEDYIKLIETINSRTENLHIGRGPLISTNVFFKNRKKANELLNSNFAHIESTTAFDTEAGGVITACYVHEVPWLLLKAVSYQIGRDEQLLSALRVGIEAQPHIGNLIETLLEELVHSFDN